MESLIAFMSAPASSEWTGNWGDWIGAFCGIVFLSICAIIVYLWVEQQSDIRF